MPDLRTARNESQRDMRNAVCDALPMETIAERLKRARVLAKYVSGSDAARAFGWPVSTYLGHENGDRVPGLDTIEKYAKAFRVNPAYIAYGGEEQLKIAPEVSSFVEIKGFVGPGGLIQEFSTSLSSGDMLKISMSLPEGAFAVMDMQGSLISRFQMQDLIIIKSGFTSDVGLIDRYVYVKTDSGKEYIRILRRGKAPRKYDLYHPDYMDDVISSVSIDELGVIVMIVPGGFYADLGVEPILARIGADSAKA